MSAPKRSLEEEKAYIRPCGGVHFQIETGFVPNMRVRRTAPPRGTTAPSAVTPRRGPQVPGAFYLNPNLQSLVYDELGQHVARGGTGGFLPAVKQIANVAALPGIVGVRPQHGPRCPAHGRATEAGSPC